MSRRWAGALVLTMALGLTACSGRSGPHASSDSSGSGSADPTCPTSTASQDWPSGVPATVPRPAGLRIVSHERSGGIAVVRFSTTESLVEAARTFRDGLPKAGFEPRGGDAEGDEVDQRFGGHGYRGALKLHGSSVCKTDGTLVGTRLRRSR